MNRTLWVLAALIALVSTVPVQAAINGYVDPKDDLHIMDLPPGWSGGPFEIKIYDHDAWGIGSHSEAPIYGPQSTFCAETEDWISFTPGWYDVYGLVEQNSAGRNLKGYAAWVYDIWAANEGTAGFTDAEKISFQNAIWAGISFDASNTNGSEYYAKNTNNITDWAPYQGLGTNDIDIDLLTFALSGWGGGTTGDDGYIADYRIVEIGIDGDNQAQMFIGSGEWEIPEPASLIVWSLLGMGSWLGMRVWRRRRGPVGRRPWSPENRTAILEIIELGARK